MMLPDLNRLKVFYHVYACQSMIQAAEALHLSQPGVSQHIRKLEEEIGTPLFVRMHKKIIPTRAGRRLNEKIKPFMDSLAEEIRMIARPDNQPFGKVSLGAPLEFGKCYLPSICHRFRTLYPDVRFTVRLDEPDRLLSMIDGGQLDLALIDYFSTWDQFREKQGLYLIRPVAEETVVLACSSGYFERRIRDDLTFDNLSRQDFVSDEHEPVILRHWFWHHFGKTLLSPNIVMAIDSHRGVISCIAEGMGMGLTAAHIIGAELAGGELVAVSAAPKPMVNQIALVRLKGRNPTLTEETFAAFLEEEVGNRKWGDAEPCLGGTPDL